MANRNTIWMAGVAAALAQLVSAQTAVLPVTYTGPWRDAPPMAGWIFSGLGSPDYLPDFDGLNDGAAKFDGTGDFISVRFAAPPESVSFWIQGFSFSGGVFRVEQSIDGTNWLTLASYASPPTNATFQTFGLSHHARHVRFLYASRVTGNVGLDGISVAPDPSIVIDRVVVSNGVARIYILPNEIGRDYALDVATNLAATSAWNRVFITAGTGGELELIDFYFSYPRYFRAVALPPSGKKTVVRRPGKSPWRP